MNKSKIFGNFFVLLGASLVGLASCTNEDENSVTPDKKGLVSIEIRGGIGGGRTHLNGLSVEFDNTDELAVWDGVEKREFKTDKGGSVALFKGEIAENATILNILYPYSAGQNCTSGTITATIPTEQTATEGTFDPEANLSVAAATYTKGQNVTCTLENVCGLLKFTIGEATSGAIEYDSVQIKGAKDEVIAGKVTISASEKEITGVTSGAKTITLKKKDDANKLTKGSTYYIVLKPQVSIDSLTMTFFTAGSKQVATIARKDKAPFNITKGVILNAGEVKPTAEVVEYIRANKNGATGSYLNTGYRYTNSADIITSICKYNKTHGTYELQGCWVDPYTQLRWGHSGSTSSTFFTVCQTDMTCSYNSTIKRTYKIAAGKKYIDGTSVGSYTFKSVDKEIVLFASLEGSGYQYSADVNNYEFKVERNGSVILDLIPCALPQNITASQARDGKSHTAGEVGMWDLVSDKFYEGVGTFEIGKDVN